MNPSFNNYEMTRLSHNDATFDRVLHIAHFEWHGIRNATAYCPGQKLLIPAEQPLETRDGGPDEIKGAILNEIQRMGITHVVAQGYSHNMDQLLVHIRAGLGREVRIFVVNHVTTSQFDHAFEMEMLSLLFLRRQNRTLDGIASVKPNFGDVFPQIWNGLIFNFAPNIPEGAFSTRSEICSAYSPLDVGWRKNMYTNVMGALLAKNVDEVRCANFPSGLENVTGLEKLRLVGYLRGNKLFEKMANSQIVLLATFAECQPMTQLEAFAVGTPAMTKHLGIKEFEKDELTQLCSTHALDDPALLALDITRLVDATKDESAASQMIIDHLHARHKLATDRYCEFLGV
ncbi:hypothetical protein [Aliiroseovarius sp.]|uniref:hypothetical protein n=1 Tax=Aliiroseovarius sp. TaxID=1872442 RepID=UPI003BAA0968